MRFHKNPAFEKITKIVVMALGWMGFLFFGACNFTGCFEIYLGLCKKVHAPAKKATKQLQKKHPTKLFAKSVALLLPFMW